MANFNASYPAGTAGGANPSVGANGVTAPTSSTEIGFINGSGNETGVSPSTPLPTVIDTSVVPLRVDVVDIIGAAPSATNPLPSRLTDGAAYYDARQIRALTSSDSITVVQPTGTNLHTVVDSSALPAGAATSANQTTANASLSSIDSKTPALGQQLAAASQPVVLTAIQYSGLIAPIADASISGTLGALNATVEVPSQGEATTVIELVSTSLVGTIIFESSNNNWTTTTPVAAVYLNGPAAQASTWVNPSVGSYSVLTAGFQKIRVRVSAYTSGTASALVNASVGSRITVALQGNPTNLQTLATQGPGGASAWKVDGSAVTQPVSAASLPLPAGAATSANQTTELGYLSTIATNSGAVVITGTALANAPVQNVYTTTAITTAAYVQLIASTTSVANSVHIFDSSGQAMILAVGGAGSEVNQYYVPPGGDNFTLKIPAGSRVSYKALTATANAGYLLLNLLG